MVSYPLNTFPTDGEWWVRPDHGLFLHPLLARGGTSDWEVFSQIFAGNPYNELSDIADVRLVIDCGANVGYSASWFLTRFPDCHVIAVEPDPGNFAVLERNLAPYGDRATLIRAGVWSRVCNLAIEKNQEGDGREWGRQVRKASEDETCKFPGVTVGSLLTSSGHDQLDILKMDIEGAEVEVFSAEDLSWLDVTRAMAIELHDWTRFGNATDVFHRAINGRGFRLSQCDDITICRQVV